MVNGQPVCDDGPAYRAATARVVCRFKFTNFLPIILFPCLFMKFLDCLFFASKSDICSLGSLDTMEQVNTRQDRTSGTSQANLQWTKCSARAMKLQSLTALIKPRTIVVEVKDWGSSAQQVNSTNCPVPSVRYKSLNCSLMVFSEESTLKIHTPSIAQIAPPSHSNGNSGALFFQADLSKFVAISLF